MRPFAIFLLGIWASGSFGAELPAKILDLSRWKLTLPVATSRPGRPGEIEQPHLASYFNPNHFFVNEAGDAVVFRAPCGGLTSKGSSYPRSELREMADQEGTPAAWSTERGIHTMSATLAITRTPLVKKQVVCAQIHDADDDLLMIRLEGKKLLVERNSIGDVLLTPNYVLGTPFELKIEANDGRVSVWYNESAKLDWKVSRDGCYFKAGCYTQSNPDKGDDPASFGEVVIYRLDVSHQPPR